MAPLTRWVLAHKRIVVVFWVLLTLIGIASAGSATKALKQKFSVPGKEGWVTNQQIVRDFHGTGGNNAPLLPVVTLPNEREADPAAIRPPAAVATMPAVRTNAPTAAITPVRRPGGDRAPPSQRQRRRTGTFYCQSPGTSHGPCRR